MRPYKFILFVIIIFGISFAQNIVKTVTFKDEEIEEVKASPNYVVVRTYKSTRPFNKIYLYDRKGNEILKKSSKVGYILQADVTDALNYLIIINMGWGDAPGYGKSNDIIQAFDIHTGQKIWETTANAALYEISPDGNFLLTKIPASDRPSPFTIINLKNGNIETPQIPGLRGYHAAWLDKDKIVIAHQILQRAPVTANEKILHSKIADFHYELGKLRLKYKMGKINKAEFEYKSDSLTNNLSSIQKKYIKIRKVQRSKIWLFKGTRVLIFNHISKQILIERTITNIEGKLFKIPSNSLLIPYVYVSVNNFIYVYGGLESDGDCLLKLGKGLELIWFSKLGNITPHTLTKIILNNKFIFAIKNVRNNKIYFIDPQSGNLVFQNNFDNVLNRIPFKNNLLSEIKSNNSELIYRAFTKLKIDKPNRKVIFYN